MKKILFVLTALIAVSCNDKEQFTPAGSDALFSYTFTYDSTLGKNQTTNSKELYRINGHTITLLLKQLVDENKNPLDTFVLGFEDEDKNNSLYCEISKLSGEYSSLEQVDIASVMTLDFDSYAEVDTGDLLSAETDPKTEITTLEYVSEEHPVYILLGYDDNGDYVGFAVRLTSVEKVETIDPYGIEVPPTSPFGDITYKSKTDYQVYVETEYKTFNKSGWL